MTHGAFRSLLLLTCLGAWVAGACSSPEPAPAVTGSIIKTQEEFFDVLENATNFHGEWVRVIAKAYCDDPNAVELKSDTDPKSTTVIEVHDAQFEQLIFLTCNRFREVSDFEIALQARLDLSCKLEGGTCLSDTAPASLYEMYSAFPQIEKARREGTLPKE